MPKDTSSSSGKIFAKPSKEYVLPERAKPGRKIGVELPDSDRQNQNRISQRAHRARRTDYVQTLEERLRQYEADEIHSNVRLQEVARALKTDNNRLKQESVGFKLSLEAIPNDAKIWAKERKSLLDAVSQLQMECNALRLQVQRVRPILSSNSSSYVSTAHPSWTRRSASPASGTPRMSLPVTRPTIDCLICPDPDPDCPCQQPQNNESDHPPASSIFPVVPDRATSQLEVLGLAVAPVAHSDLPSCGLCQSVDECLCRAVQAGPSHHVVKSNLDAVPASESCGLCTTADFCACREESANSSLPSLTTSRSTFSLPLRIRRRSHLSTAPVWLLQPSESPAYPNPTCSGDPTNCAACKDDSFGREFCTNLYSRTSATTSLRPCNTCPGNCMNIQSSLVDPDKPPRSSRPPNEDSMPPDMAWKTLKPHPNARSVSMAMLADVVARGALCVGPTDDRAHAPVRTVGAGPGHDTSIRRTAKRTIKVGASAVRDALRILDGASPPLSA